MHCHEQSQSQNDKTAPHKKCCCYDTPIKNIEHFKISYSFDHSLNPIAYLDIPIMLKKYHVGPVLNYSQKRYRPFGLYSDDNILSLKQSFLI